MRRTAFIYLVTAIVLISCGKEKDHYPEYFEGRVNGQEFHPKGIFWICTDISARGGRNGFTFEAENCETGERIIFSKPYQLSEMVYTSVDPSDTLRPQCTFANSDFGYTTLEGHYETFSARHELEIRLEIINIQHIEEHDQYYIEGRLDAIVQDTILDSTVVISDVRFGHKY